jgi:hypothetical protein
MSPDPFFDSFEEELDLRKWSFDKHRTAGLSLVFHNGRVYLGGMTPSTPGWGQGGPMACQPSWGMVDQNWFYINFDNF